MSLYTQFARYYEDIFPLREDVLAFLLSHFAPGTRRVLDIGCGTGHYCGRLAQEGFEVLGIDADPGMIVASETRYPSADFRTLDMLDIDILNSTFDAAFSIGNVLSHLKPEEVERFIGKLAAILNSGGIWVFQVVNWAYILKRKSYEFPQREMKEKNLIFERRYDFVSPLHVLFHTELLNEGRSLFSDSVSLYPMLSMEYLKVHEDAGFECLEHYADFTQNPFRADRDSACIYVMRLRS